MPRKNGHLHEYPQEVISQYAALVADTGTDYDLMSLNQDVLDTYSQRWEDLEEAYFQANVNSACDGLRFFERSGSTEMDNVDDDLTALLKFECKLM
jgi:hypothetical protein